jgi:Zn-dependent protease
MFTVAFFIFIILGAIIHEYSHAWMADYLGDPTARNAGRLTLNPLAHIDWFGTIILPLLMLVTFGAAFGYAKPVPYNPYNLKNQRRDPALVAVAGPGSNLFLALALSLIIRFIPLSQDFIRILGVGVYANVLLLVFNLVPIPPLDGSKVLYALIPNTPQGLRIKVTLERYGFMILIFFIFFAFRIIIPVIIWVLVLLLGNDNTLLLLRGF